MKQLVSIHYLDRKIDIEDLVAINWDQDSMLKYLTEKASQDLQLPREKAKKTILQIYKLATTSGHSLCCLGPDNSLRSMLLVLPPYQSETQEVDGWLGIITKTIAPQPAIIKKLNKIDAEKDTFRIFKFLSLSPRFANDESILIDRLKVNAMLTSCRCFDARHDRFYDVMNVVAPNFPIFVKIANIRLVRKLTDCIISAFFATPIISFFFEKALPNNEEISNFKNFMSFNMAAVLIESDDVFLSTVVPSTFENAIIVAHSKKAASDFLTKFQNSLSKNAKVPKEACSTMTAIITRYKEAITITHSHSFIIFGTVFDRQKNIEKSMNIFLSKIVPEFRSMNICPSLIVPDLRPVLQVFNKTLHSEAIDDALAKNKFKRVPCERNHEVYYKFTD